MLHHFIEIVTKHYFLNVWYISVMSVFNIKYFCYIYMLKNWIDVCICADVAAHDVTACDVNGSSIQTPVRVADSADGHNDVLHGQQHYLHRAWERVSRRSLVQLPLLHT